VFNFNRRKTGSVSNYIISRGRKLDSKKDQVEGLHSLNIENGGNHSGGVS
jgi:hypothetical protein